MSNTSKLAAIKTKLKKQPAAPEARFQRAAPDRKRRLQLYVEPDVYDALMRHYKALPITEPGASMQKLIGAAILALDHVPQHKLVAHLEELIARDLRYKENR